MKGYLRFYYESKLIWITAPKFVAGKACISQKFSTRTTRPPNEEESPFNPANPEKEPFSFVAAIAGVSTSSLNLLQKKYDFSLKSLLKFQDNFFLEERLKSQAYIEKRHRILGSNLASAHFVIARGGKIRFKGEKKWTALGPDGKVNLPDKFAPNMYLEAIDITGMDLLYEGLENFTNLTHLETFILSGPDVDDWFLDRIHIFSESLQDLTIDNCPLLTLGGLCNIHKLSKLKALKLSNLPNIKHKQLFCMLVEDYFPNIHITCEAEEPGGLTAPVLDVI